MYKHTTQLLRMYIICQDIMGRVKIATNVDNGVPDVGIIFDEAVIEIKDSGCVGGGDVAGTVKKLNMIWICMSTVRMYAVQLHTYICMQNNKVRIHINSLSNMDFRASPIITYIYNYTNDHMPK